MEYDRHLSYYPPNSPTVPPPRDQQKRHHQNHLTCFSSCFRSPRAETEAETSLVRSSSWIRSKAHELPDDFRGRCRNFLGRHKRRHSSDFGYDPLSYARNFDDGGESTGDNEEEFPYKCFSSRLPQSPRALPSPRPPVPEVGTMPAERIGRVAPLLEKPEMKGKSLLGMNSV